MNKVVDWIKMPQKYNYTQYPNMFECTNCCKYTYELSDYCPNCGKKRGKILDYKDKDKGE